MRGAGESLIKEGWDILVFIILSNMGFYYNQPKGFYYNQEQGFYYDQPQQGFYYDQQVDTKTVFQILLRKEILHRN